MARLLRRLKYWLPVDLPAYAAVLLLLGATGILASALRWE